MAKSRLTNTGQPALGTTIEVRLVDQTWIPLKVVGKLWGKGGSGDLVGLSLEEVQEPYVGQRQVLDWKDLDARGSWRPL